MLSWWVAVVAMILLRCFEGVGYAQEVQPFGMPQPIQGEDAERLIDSFLRGELAPAGSKAPAGTLRNVPEVIFETTSLLPDGSFETTDFGLPDGWNVEIEDAVCALERSGSALLGSASLHCVPGAIGLARVSSPLLALDPDMISLSAQIMSRPASGRARLLFRDIAGQVMEEMPLRVFSGQGDWTRHHLNDTPIPAGASTVQFVLESAEPTFWDGAEVTANSEHKPRCVILLNPLGYELIGPKVFVVAANFSAGSARFSLRDAEGRQVWSSGLNRPERVISGGGFDWGQWFYPGDFSDFQDEGTFTLAVDLDGVTAEVPGVVVAFDRYWQTLFPACVEGLTRLGAERGEGEFWRDPGGSGVDQTLLFYHLAADYRSLLWRMRRPDAPQGFARECARCAGLAAERIKGAVIPRETPPDEALYRLAAGLIILARYHPQVRVEPVLFTPLLEAARRQNTPSRWVFAFGWHYRQLFNDPSLDSMLSTLNPGISMEILDELLEAEGENALSGIESVTVEIGMAANSAAAVLAARSRGAFGLYQAVEKPIPRFFPVPDASGQLCPGNSRVILQAAEYMAQYYRFAPRPEYLRFVYSQLNWVLGCNPLNQCVVWGMSREHGPAGAQTTSSGYPGIVLEGIGARSPTDDRPWFPENCDAGACHCTPSLSATFHLLNTLAHLKRIRVPMPDEKKQ